MQTVSNRYDDLAERATQDIPQPWVPSESDPLLVGTFQGFENGSTSYGPARAVVLRTQDGQERSLWLFHTSVRNEISRARPKHGELVAVRYLGKKQGAQGQSYDDYRVVVQRDEGAPDGDTLGSEDDDGGDWGQHSP